MHDKIVQFYCGGHAGRHRFTIKMTSSCTLGVAKQPGSSSSPSWLKPLVWMVWNLATYVSSQLEDGNLPTIAEIETGNSLSISVHQFL